MLHNRCTFNVFGYCKLRREKQPQSLVYSPGPVVVLGNLEPCKYRWDTCPFFVSYIEELRQDGLESKTEGIEAST